MSKPRWIDSGVFKTLRTATRKRNLAIIVGPGHGTADVTSRAQLRDALGEGDRSSLADDARCKSKPDAGLTAIYRLRQPGIVTTAVSDTLAVSAPEELTPARRFGPDSKGMKGAWDRKDGFVAQLCGAATEPESLVLSQKDRKALTKPDSRYQNFLRTTFQRLVLFTGFELDDPDLTELLDDVARVFNGHVPMNIALVPAGATDPSTALRASMHYGTAIVEFPADSTAEQALKEVGDLLEDLEIPKPATGNPPVGFTELVDSVRAGVAPADEELLERFDRGDSSSWESIKGSADAARTPAAEIAAFLQGDSEEGQVNIVLVRGAEGQGKTTMIRRIAWSLAEEGRRVFWREFGAGLPDRYVPEEADGAQAIFVADDADQLDNLPSLLNSLSGHGQGKARFLLATDTQEWDRSGLDHRIRRYARVLDLTLGSPDEAECREIAKGLAARQRLAEGLTVESASEAMAEGDETRVLMDRIAFARGVGSIRDAVFARLGAMGNDELSKRAYLGVSMVHRFNMSLGRQHLASLLKIEESELDAKVLGPMRHSLVTSETGAVRTRHPVVASVVCGLLAADDEVRDAMAVELLSSLPGGSVSDPSVFHQPSELIRRLRQFPMAPLSLNRFFEAGEDAGGNDVNFWFDRGRVDVDFARWEGALHHFEQALWRHPGDTAQKHHNATVHGYRARCLESLSRKKEALNAVDEGLRCSPHDSALGRLRDRLGGRRPQRAGGPGGRRREGGEGGGGGRGAGGGGRGARGGGGRGGAAGGASRRGPPAGAGKSP